MKISGIHIWRAFKKDYLQRETDKQLFVVNFLHGFVFYKKSLFI
jgi:hypothetical protein